jgi:outer membrane protein OmpA-like peptidoglycan-associated protein
MKPHKLCSFILILFFSFANSLFAQEDINKTVSEQDTLKSPQEIADFLKKSRSLKKETKLSNLEMRLAIHFDFDSFTLNPPAKLQLDNLAKVLLGPDFSTLSIELAGHTCDLGSTDYNDTLSRNRVESAKNYLITAYNINPSRISTWAYGERLPFIPGAKTEKERAINRRVVTYLPENRETIERLLRDKPFEHGFSWGVFHYRKDNKVELIEYDGSSQLKSEDEYRVFLSSTRKKYVYLYQVDSRGKGEWLFPRNDIEFSNPVEPGEHFLPSREKVFVLDNNIGKESIFLVVTDEPVAELEMLFQNHSPELFSEVVTKTVKTRGLKNIKIGPPADSTDTSENTVIMDPNPQSKPPRNDDLRQGIPKDNIVNIMAQYSEFFMVLEFGHK